MNLEFYLDPEKDLFQSEDPSSKELPKKKTPKRVEKPDEKSWRKLGAGRFYMVDSIERLGECLPKGYKSCESYILRYWSEQLNKNPEYLQKFIGNMGREDLIYLCEQIIETKFENTRKCDLAGSIKKVIEKVRRRLREDNQ